MSAHINITAGSSRSSSKQSERTIKHADQSTKPAESERSSKHAESMRSSQHAEPTRDSKHVGYFWKGWELMGKDLYKFDHAAFPFIPIYVQALYTGTGKPPGFTSDLGSQCYITIQHFLEVCERHRVIETYTCSRNTHRLKDPQYTAQLRAWAVEEGEADPDRYVAEKKKFEREYLKQSRQFAKSLGATESELGSECASSARESARSSAKGSVHESAKGSAKGSARESAKGSARESTKKPVSCIVEEDEDAVSDVLPVEESLVDDAASDCSSASKLRQQAAVQESAALRRSAEEFVASRSAGRASARKSALAADQASRVPYVSAGQTVVSVPRMSERASARESAKESARESAYKSAKESARSSAKESAQEQSVAVIQSRRIRAPSPEPVEDQRAVALCPKHAAQYYQSSAQPVVKLSREIRPDGTSVDSAEVRADKINMTGTFGGIRFKIKADSK